LFFAIFLSQFSDSRGTILTMSFFLFLSEAVLISLSGVMAPGPITAVVVGKSSESPKAGALVAIGHGIVELPLMVAVFLGLGRLLDAVLIRAMIGIAGGVFVIWMGVGMLRHFNQHAVDPERDTRSPLVSGILLSIANPYFLVWWGTVGAALILRSFEFGLIGFIAFALGHWLCDLAWDSLLGVAAFKGGQFFGNRFQQVVFALSGVMLLFFGGRLVWDGVSLFLA
jgi:threonine/homoserine/homoserine lactone efflux protein